MVRERREHDTEVDDLEAIEHSTDSSQLKPIVSSVSRSDQKTEMYVGDDPLAWSGITPHLRILCPERGCWEVDIKGPQMLVGRHASCDVVLPASTVSRRHLLIDSEEGSYYIRDMNSHSGTLINGERIQPEQRYLLQHMDSIQISRQIIQFRRDDRRIRSDNAKEMRFSRMPSSVQVRVRTVHCAPEDIYDSGDTLLVGSSGGGLYLPIESGFNFSVDTCLDIEMIYPGGRYLNIAAELLIRHEVKDLQVLCVKLHKLEKDLYEELLSYRRDPWISVIRL